MKAKNKRPKSKEYRYIHVVPLHKDGTHLPKNSRPAKLFAKTLKILPHAVKKVLDNRGVTVDFGYKKGYAMATDMKRLTEDFDHLIFLDSRIWRLSDQNVVHCILHEFAHCLIAIEGPGRHKNRDYHEGGADTLAQYWFWSAGGPRRRKKRKGG
jgi:hypothetical protein